MKLFTNVCKWFAPKIVLHDILVIIQRTDFFSEKKSCKLFQNKLISS